MLKKSALLTSVVLLAACSSPYTEQTDYVDNVIVQKTKHQDYVEIVGKEIIPVDLLELNLGLKVSLLSVTAKVADADQAAQSTEQKPLQSDVAFSIKYTRKKEQMQQTASNSKDKQDFDQYDVALVDGTRVELQSNKVSQSCADKTCTTSQSFTFPVDSSLLQASKVDGLKFKLYETTHRENLVLETMIPGRYISALLAKQ